MWKALSVSKAEHEPLCSWLDKGVLKYLSADESLSKVYGNERFKDDGSLHPVTRHSKSRSVIFTAIEIREYARTVGDNPSCSSGPPIS
jgi:hypothetical protein